MVAQLNHVLSDEKVVKDAENILRQELEKREGEALGDFEPDEIPPANAPIDVVSKVVAFSNYGYPFRTHYTAEVAIGGIECQANGFVTPKYFFATLYYGDALQVIAFDFHEELR